MYYSWWSTTSRSKNVALDDDTLKNDLYNSFYNVKYWSSTQPENDEGVTKGCAELLAEAIESYINSGEIDTTIAITITSPFGVVTTATISGSEGIITAPPSSSLASQIATLFLTTCREDWTIFPPLLANHINSYFKNSTIQIPTYTAGYTPTVPGFKYQIESDAGLVDLQQAITNTFTTQDIDWDTALDFMKEGLSTFITQTNIIKTIDAGTMADTSTWVNTPTTNGQGTIS